MFNTRAVTILAILCAVASGSAADESHESFVGLSKGSARGDAGILTMHRLCGKTFRDSRMCTSRDIQLSVNPPAIERTGWVQPIFVPFHSEPGAFDISGKGLITELQEKLGEDFTTPRDLSCNGWSSAEGGFGLALSGGSTDGTWNIIQCDFTAQVACCGPRSRARRRDDLRDRR